MKIFNVAVIAHVDHGKTTLIDGMLKQARVFRENEAEMNMDCIMDSNTLERERGITILAKNTSVHYGDAKINIIDTPGHKDFSGEVERVIGMADGALLIVDSAEGPLAQTKFVLKEAFKKGLKIIVVINKIDRKDTRADEVLEEIENLFLQMAETNEQLEFPVLYAIGREGRADRKLPLESTDLRPLFEDIIHYVPEAQKDNNGFFQMVIANIDYDNHLGRLAIGRIRGGKLSVGNLVKKIDHDGNATTKKIEKIYVFNGLKREEVQEAPDGEIVAIAGVDDVAIGDNLIDPKLQDYTIEKIEISEPTLKMNFSANTSPLAGREGKYVTGKQLMERLWKEREKNVGLRVTADEGQVGLTVAGRGEMHLSVLIENLRREGYELQVSKPEVIEKTIDHVLCEPFEEVEIEIENQFLGFVTEEMGGRAGEMQDMKDLGNSKVRLVYKVATRAFLGFRSRLLTATHGTGLVTSNFLGYFPKINKEFNLRSGVILVDQPGIALAYGLNNAQERGTLFIGAGIEVYEGMIVGANAKNDDLEINVCRGKKLTNMHTENSDEAIKLTPPLIMSLEESLEFLAEDELLEVTPKSLRLRKKFLTHTARVQAKRKP